MLIIYSILFLISCAWSHRYLVPFLVGSTVTLAGPEDGIKTFMLMPLIDNTKNTHLLHMLHTHTQYYLTVKKAVGWCSCQFLLSMLIFVFYSLWCICFVSSASSCRFDFVFFPINPIFPALFLNEFTFRALFSRCSAFGPCSARFHPITVTE